MFSKIKKIDLLELFVLLMPIIDVINTITGLSISLLARGLFLLGLAIYFVFFNKSNYKKISYILLFILGLFSFTYLFHYFILNGTYNIINEFITLIKFLYLPITIIFLINYYDNKNLNISEIITKIAWIYCLLIIIPTILGVSLESYSDGKLGTSGLFYSPNELSAILTIISPFAVFSLFKKENKIFNIILNVIFIIACYLIGTKTPVMGLLISLILAVIISLIRQTLYKNNLMNIIIAVIFLVSSVFCYQISYLKTNLNYQSNNYGDETPTDDPDDIGDNNSNDDNIQNQINKELHQNDFLINFPTQPYTNKINDNKILNLIFSSRNIYMQTNLNKFANTILSKQIFGLTLGPSENTPDASNTSEMDMIDIFIYYGVIGAIVLVGYLLILLVLSIIKYLKNFKDNIKDDNITTSLISYGIALLIAFTAGHVLSAPAVSLFVALSLCFIIKYFKIYHNSKKNYSLKILIGISILYILVSLFIIISCQDHIPSINLTIENNELTSNTEIEKVEEQLIEFNDITDNLKYYVVENYKNIQIIYVTRTFANNETIEFITLNNNENVTINFNLSIKDNLENYERKNNYLYIEGDETKLISNTYHYAINSRDIKSFNKYAYKNLINENTDYLVEENVINKKIELKANESADTYIITLQEKINYNDDLPWLSFTGYYKNLTNNVYVESNMIAESDSSVLSNLYTNSYLINLYKYSNYAQGIWYNDYYIVPYTSFKRNNLFISAQTNYIINNNLENTNFDTTLYIQFANLIKQHYYDNKYLRTDEGIIINELTDTSFGEQVNIVNILLRIYLINNDERSRLIALDILNELESENWINKTDIYEYITSDLKYLGKVSDPMVIWSLIELKDNLEACNMNSTKIEEYINLLYSSLKDQLTNEQVKMLKEGDYIE